MVGAGRHAGLRRHTRAISLVALHIALIGQGLLGIHGDIGGHVSSRPHVRVLGDAWAAGLRWEMAWGLLGRVDLVTAVYPILAARRRLGCIEARLDKVLPFRLGDEGLELGGGESIDKARLGHDKQQNLSARQDRQFVCLLHDSRFPLGEGDVATRLVADKLDLNLPPLTAALLVVVVVIVGSGARSLDAATLAGGAIANRMRVVELGGRRLVVLVGDVGHDG